MLAPLVGKLIDRYPPQPIVGSGFSALAIGLTWLSFGLTPDTPLWQLVLPFIAMGIGMAFIWSPLAATATRNLPPRLAGAGSGVYNATRQVGSVLGSAGMAAYMTSRISAEMPAGGRPVAGEGTPVTLPPFLHEPFATAMSQSLLLPAFVALFGVVAALFLRGQATAAPLVRPRTSVPEPPEPNYFPDDDDYVEYTVDRTEFDAVDDSDPWDWYDAPAEPDEDYEDDYAPYESEDADEPRTSPIPMRVDHWHSPRRPEVMKADAPSAPRRGRHYREDDEADDPGVYGLHSM